MKERGAEWHRGFTLVEIIATLGLTLFIMGALFQAILNQSRSNEVAGERLSEGQVARSLLYRMAEELRQVYPPTAPKVDPARARALLAYGQQNLGGEEEGAGVSVETGTAAEGDEIPEVEGAERFALLGTKDRLLLMTRVGPEISSPIDRYLAEKGERETEGGNAKETKRLEPSRWSDLRQVCYLARPLPEALDSTKEDLVEAPEEASPDGTKPIKPMFGGVIRQEVRLVFSNDAQADSFFQLRDHLFAKEEEGLELPKMEEPAVLEMSSEKEVPLPDRTATEVLTEQITAIRFRYHDGQSWLESWSDAGRLPVAVEIHLSFDPRAADPEFLSEYLEENPLGGTATEDGVSGSMATAEESEEPVFGYRLVVALPMAEPVTPMVSEDVQGVNRSPTDATTGVGEGLP
jgi:hypothetical protein